MLQDFLNLFHLKSIINLFLQAKSLLDKVVYDDQEFLVYKLLCSPTRTYAPILNKIIKHCKNEIQGIIHCSGGAQTKVLKFVHGVKIIKDNLFTTPPVFQMIQDEMNYSKRNCIKSIIWVIEWSFMWILL